VSFGEISRYALPSEGVCKLETQRIIKFRAWDKRLLVMRGNINDVDVRDFFSIRSDGLTHDDYILIQFTGLLDKNGKEIWEGDIVKAKFRYDTDKEDKPAKNETKFEVKYKINQHSQFCGFDFFPSDFTTIEVIGNIYENPDRDNKFERR
jgi:uncharacterized phage protein (TIGR01671 family)